MQERREGIAYEDPLRSVCHDEIITKSFKDVDFSLDVEILAIKFLADFERIRGLFIDIYTTMNNDFSNQKVRYFREITPESIAKRAEGSVVEIRESDDARESVVKYESIALITRTASNLQRRAAMVSPSFMG